jgi:thimet oligopeptidase
MAAPSPDAARTLVGSPQQFTEACQRDIERCRAGVARFKDDKALAQASVSARLAVYDEAASALSDAGSRASVARNAHPDSAMRDAAEQAEQEVEKLATELSLDRRLYEVLTSLDVQGEDAITKRWVGRTLRDFRRAGVDRDEPTRVRVKALNEQLVKIGQEFARNIREDVRKAQFEPHQLDGLPEDYRKSHPPGADGKVTVTTDYPDYIPFISYAKDAKAREAIWRVSRKRGHPANLEVLNQLLRTRHELATLLGYADWAAYVTEDKMIGSAEHAASFIERITTGSAARCERDYASLLERKRKEEPGAERVNPWDQPFLEDRLRAERYHFDSQSVRPYFEYGRVKQGVLDTTAKLFGIRYQRVSDAPVWHADVECYDLFEGDERRGRLYLDMHPREGKYKHAAQFSLAGGRRGAQLPEGVLMCNFPRPGEQPALMLHSDVQTFFHEFGHLLHHLLGGHTRWAAQAGVRTEWDFVEAPSQLLEEWTWDPEVLATFARHIETNQPLPIETVKRMREADRFGKGIWARQQMFYAAISLSFHRGDPSKLDTTAKVRELQGRYTPFPYVDDTYFHLAFGHLDGYSAIYYTYMWSLVIAKDLFTVFREKGLMNTDVAGRYRKSVLEPGGSRDAAELVRDFLGRDYDFRAYQAWLDEAA